MSHDRVPIADAARLTGVPASTIRRWIAEGRVTYTAPCPCHGRDCTWTATKHGALDQRAVPDCEVGQRTVARRAYLRITGVPDGRIPDADERTTP